ncbi:small integral membrane protein 4 [Copidosoma floridanum]|uniref:small integral membrane protein 4 n=1 Tax=Copidosoma floridanum TaxID=29053 RepID=UPI0006C9C78F|nr:small integral membrane protein 4 [Copidosoma floridanum]
MYFYSKKLRKFLRVLPGKKYLGEYRFLPIFFIGGAVIEFLMINWHVGEVNFYKVYKKRKVEELVKQCEREELLKLQIKKT